MNKLSKEEMWSIAESVAAKMGKEGFVPANIQCIEKSEMAKYDERINNIPSTISMYDGKDYDEDDTFDYLKILVKFHLAVLSNPNVKR